MFDKALVEYMYTHGETKKNIGIYEKLCGVGVSIYPHRNWHIFVCFLSFFDESEIFRYLQIDAEVWAIILVNSGLRTVRFWPFRG